ncbi:hypothetical protein Gorai_019041 [Gossypium raimondii]|uniref:DUF4283 domain-containing protein n=1 Tax=Gossypium raimondii TaxID=29730 RepID=A0A7J8PM95_GOSRA|nr:hypothetical protein [Gossypium raimondii]
MEAPPDTDSLIVDVNGQKAKDDGHVVTKLVEGILLITLSDRIHQLIESKMARTITINLLGRKIGFNSLLNKVTSLWSPKSHMQLMDLENYYYLVRFQDKGDFNKLPGLSESYYSNFLLRAISQAIGPVVKLDVHTSSRRRGRFARDGNVQQKKPPDCELVGSANLIVEVTTMEGIVRGIERGPDADLIEDVLLLVMGIMDDYIANYDISC